MRPLKSTAAALAGALVAGTGWAQTPEPTWPHRIPAPGGEVIIASEGQMRSYERLNYAPARRVGDTLYVSGMLIYRGDGEGHDAAAFEAQVRRTFERLQRMLQASGASLDDVVMMNSFHVWDGPNFTGTRDEQIAIINKVRAEFTTAPYPAWTAVGTTGLLAPSAIVEVQVIAHLPEAH